MQLSLADFESAEEPPEWLPTEKWEDILALSVLPGNIVFTFNEKCLIFAGCVIFALFTISW